MKKAFFFFLTFVFYTSDGWPGPWKRSLNFTLLRTNFDQIDGFHAGLSFLERSKTGSFSLSGARLDTIGNAFYDVNGDVKCHKNTRNVALASVQFIYNSSGMLNSHFSHVTCRSGQRFFYSSRGARDYENDVRKHLHDKMHLRGWSSDYYPSMMKNPDYFRCYHQHPHSEDYIFYSLSQASEKIVQDFVRSPAVQPIDSIEAIILHLNSRFDMCGNCAYALDWELRDKLGFAQLILNAASKLNKLSPDVFFTSFVSSRQDYSGVWGCPRRSIPEVIAGPTTKVPYKFDGFNDFVSRLHLSPRDDKRFFQLVVPSFFDVPKLSVEEGWIHANS